MCKIGNYISFWSENFDLTSISAGHSCIKLSDYINDHRIQMQETLIQIFGLLKTIASIRNTIISFVLLVHDFLPWDTNQNLVHFLVWKITIRIPQIQFSDICISFLTFIKFMKIY